MEKAIRDKRWEQELLSRMSKSSLTLGQCRANDQNFHRQLFGIVGNLAAAETCPSSSDPSLR
jgi:hypothetical protein